MIFPVFAGMILAGVALDDCECYFPRIRGDDPETRDAAKPVEYIFPVFAGMIPRIGRRAGTDTDFPRIRGDDPDVKDYVHKVLAFSPYSRG